MDKQRLQAAFIGGMCGSALGDAIGELAFEYRERVRLYEAIEKSPALRYTDDTAMAIGIAEELCKSGDLDVNSLGDRFKKNYEKEPWRGYGPGPPKVFSLVGAGYSYAQAASMLFNGSGSFGNGSAMRIAPVGLYFYDSPALAEKAHISAMPTHAHPIAKDGSAILAKAVAEALTWNEGPKVTANEFCDKLSSAVTTPEFSEKLSDTYALLSEASSRTKAARELGTNVTCHGSVPFAIFCFLKNSDSFENCLLDAVLAGGDRDTIGAMACAISGAYLGMAKLPRRWLEKLENASYIENLAADLSRRCGKYG